MATERKPTPARVSVSRPALELALSALRNAVDGGAYDHLPADAMRGVREAVAELRRVAATCMAEPRSPAPRRR